MDIKQTMTQIHANAIDKGFWDDKASKNVGELLMLVVSELGEGLEAHRKGKVANVEAYKERVSTLTDSLNRGFVQDVGVVIKDIKDKQFEFHIKDTFADEVADAVIRLFDMSEGLSIDLEWHIEQKMRYNQGRPRLHGKKY
jgi:NTP pyrophosphatase (non-canonical NTP hydrolase)